MIRYQTIRYARFLTLHSCTLNKHVKCFYDSREENADDPIRKSNEQSCLYHSFRTRKHSSRMRIARWLPHMFRWPPLGVDTILDTCLWKHYLPQTSFAGGNNINNMKLPQFLVVKKPKWCVHVATSLSNMLMKNERKVESWSKLVHSQ